MLRKVRIGLGLLILAASILFLLWGYWPARRELRVRPVFGTGSAQAEADALGLLFPPKVRVGEVGVVRLTLAVDALDDLFPVTGESDTSKIFDTYHVITEARFDLPGILVRPSELISAPVLQGQTAVFYWTLRPGDTGKFRGTIWLYLRLVDRLTGEERRETVSAQIVEIESVNFFGLPVSRVRVIGMTGLVIGLVLSLPFLEARISGFLQKRSIISK